MRKGYRSADARLMFFEKELLYCKLTVAIGIRKELLWRVIRKVCVKEKLLVCKKGGFSAHAKPTNKEKPFFSTAKFQFPTALKITCSNPFQISLATVSLQQNSPFSKLRNLASDVRLPFRTDSNPHRRYPGRLSCPSRPVT